MISVCFPQEIILGTDDGRPRRLLAQDPARVQPGQPLDPARIYLVVEEILQSVGRDCMNKGLALPVCLREEVVKNLASPVPIAKLLSQPESLAGKDIRVCLMNGGGGGLGDGIMFGPALEIFFRRLREMGAREIELDIFSVFPNRTGSVLGRIPYVRVLAIPVALAEFMTYDAYADFTGMLRDEAFQKGHMTDFVLTRMGMAPSEIPAREKEPFLNLPDSPSAVKAALASARSIAGQRPLIAFVFKSSYTRTMPDSKAVEIIHALYDQGYQPVLLMTDEIESEAFIARHDLFSRIIDLSTVSRAGFGHFMGIIAELDAVVSVDTSAVHIGAALRIATVGLFSSINGEFRIRYSPTAKAVQLNFRGRTCHSPCGLSKSAAFIQGGLADGRTFRLEFGYACDEAVNKDELISSAMERIQAMDPGADVESRIEAVRRETAAKFLANSAPCWESLETATVLAALDEAKEAAGRIAVLNRCPVCSTEARHLVAGREYGRLRLRCGTCHCSFVSGAEEDRAFSSPASAAVLPGPEIAEVRFIRDLVAPYLRHGANPILLVGTGESLWDAAWRQVLEPSTGSVEKFALIPWREVSAKTADQPYGLILAAGGLDLAAGPYRLVESLLAHLRPGGYLVYLTLNRPGLARPVHEGQRLAAGVQWLAKSHRALADRLDAEPIWSVTTPFGWESLRQQAGPMTPLRVQPPGLPEVIIELTGQDLDSTFKNYLDHSLRELHDHGRFLATCVRKR